MRLLWIFTQEKYLTNRIFQEMTKFCYLDLHRKQTQCVCVCVCVFHLSVCDICQCVRPDETVTVETNLSLIYQCYQWQGWVYCCPDQTHTHTHTHTHRMDLCQQKHKTECQRHTLSLWDGGQFWACDMCVIH